MNKHELKTNEVATPLVEQIAIIRRGEGMKRVLGLYLGKDKRPLLREGQKVSERDLESIRAAIEKATETKDSEIEMLHRQRQAAERQRDSVIRQSAAQPQRIDDCYICGEDAVIVPCGGQFFVRVRRMNKCQSKYKKEGYCKTNLCATKQEAIDAWNYRT